MFLLLQHMCSRIFGLGGGGTASPRFTIYCRYYRLNLKHVMLESLDDDDGWWWYKALTWQVTLTSATGALIVLEALLSSVICFTQIVLRHNAFFCNPLIVSIRLYRLRTNWSRSWDYPCHHDQSNHLIHHDHSKYLINFITIYYV